jgi:hypothetical protein
MKKPIAIAFHCTADAGSEPALTLSALTVRRASGTIQARAIRVRDDRRAGG